MMCCVSEVHGRKVHDSGLSQSPNGSIPNILLPKSDLLSRLARSQVTILAQSGSLSSSRLTLSRLLVFAAISMDSSGGPGGGNSLPPGPDTMKVLELMLLSLMTFQEKCRRFWTTDPLHNLVLFEKKMKCKYISIVFFGPLCIFLLFCEFDKKGNCFERIIVKVDISLGMYHCYYYYCCCSFGKSEEFKHKVWKLYWMYRE